MGEVYRARDTKLNRDVAIKILPDAFADDSDRVAGFRRETFLDRRESSVAVGVCVHAWVAACNGSVGLSSRKRFIMGFRRAITWRRRARHHGLSWECQ